MLFTSSSAKTRPLQCQHRQKDPDHWKKKDLRRDIGTLGFLEEDRTQRINRDVTRATEDFHIADVRHSGSDRSIRSGK